MSQGRLVFMFAPQHSWVGSQPLPKVRGVEVEVFMMWWVGGIFTTWVLCQDPGPESLSWSCSCSFAGGKPVGG